MSTANFDANPSLDVTEITPYSQAWLKHKQERENQNLCGEPWVPNNCEECGGEIRQSIIEVYCGACGLIHRQEMYWQVSLEIEARRQQFDHNSENGNGTLQNQHDTVVEDSAGKTTFDGTKLEYNVYPLDQYNDGRDGHRGRQDDQQKLDRERRFLEQRAEACATRVGLTGQQVREVTWLVTSINSGAFTSYGPEREGGGQDAHIVAAIGYVGNRHLPSDPRLVDLSDRMEARDEYQSLCADLGIDSDDVRGALQQLREQLRQ